MSNREPEITRDDFDRLHPKLIAIFRRKGVGPEQAEDLVQETFLRMCRSLSTFEGRSALDTWAISIAKNVWLQEGRNQTREKRHAEQVPIDDPATSAVFTDPGVGAEDELQTRERLGRVGRAIARLPEALQQALLLSTIHGEKHRVIASLLQTTENGVASLIHQARKKIRSEVCD